MKHRRPDRRQLELVRKSMHHNLDAILDSWLPIDAMWDGYPTRDEADDASDADSIHPVNGHSDVVGALATGRNPARDWINARDRVERSLQTLVDGAAKILPPSHVAVCAMCRKPIGRSGGHKVEGRFYHVSGGCYMRMRRQQAKAALTC